MRELGVPMLAMLNPKIVAELDTLAAAWTAVDRDLTVSTAAQQPPARDRKRKSKNKTKP